MSSWVHIHLRHPTCMALVGCGRRTLAVSHSGACGTEELVASERSQGSSPKCSESVQPEGTAKSNSLLGKLARESFRSSEINSRLYLPVPRVSVRVFNWVKNGYKINNVFIWTAVALTCLGVLLFACRIHPRKPLCNYRERWKK